MPIGNVGCSRDGDGLPNPSGCNTAYWKHYGLIKQVLRRLAKMWRLTSVMSTTAYDTKCQTIPVHTQYTAT